MVVADGPAREFIKKCHGWPYYSHAYKTMQMDVTIVSIL